MKKLAYILLIVLFVVSCKEQDMKSENASDALEEEVFTADDKAMASEINTFEVLSIQKLIEYFDLLKLKSEHPEFEEDITSQLQAYSKESLFENKLNRYFKIGNIHKIGEVQNSFDSIKRIQLRFEVVFGKERLTDSIFANITSKVILVDGQRVKTNKVLFSKE